MGETRASDKRNSVRTLSYSEVSKALSCQVAWDFSYGGRLAGSTLKPRELAPILSNGRAWGAAVATLHANATDPLRTALAYSALDASLEQDRLDMIDRGFYPDLGAIVSQRDHLTRLLEHYDSTAELLPNLTMAEHELNVRIPGRRGGYSSRYRFQAYIDGWTEDYWNHYWIVEYKLRDTLQDTATIELGRQPLWYAWALREEWRRLGIDRQLAGVLVDERLNVVPKPPRINKTGKMSHARNQLCTAEAYLALCQEQEVDMDKRLPNGDTPRQTLEVLTQRKWQQRVPIVFRPGELDEAGEELVSSARFINSLDSGDFYPVRNAKPQVCRHCDFRRVCKSPQDELLVDVHYTRGIPKRLKPPRGASNA